MAAVKEQSKAWVVAVDMGYGHQRAAYPLKDIAYGGPCRLPAAFSLP